MSDLNPLEILGLGANATPTDVKRAYFELLPQYPPERDPDGFRRLRDAYDALRRPGGLERAASGRGFSREAALAELDARLSPLEAAAARALASAALEKELEVRLEHFLSGSTWTEILAWGNPNDRA